MTQIGAIGVFAGLAAIATVLRWRATAQRQSAAPLNTAVLNIGAVNTALINIIGAFIAGLLAAYSGPFVTAVVAGGLGALTTVSGLATQVAMIWQAKPPTSRWLAAGYLAGMVIVGIFAAWLGLQLTSG